MPKTRSVFVLVVAISMLLWLTGCEVPEDRLSLLASGESVKGVSLSNFVSAYRVLPIRLGQPIPIESYHLDRDGRLGTLEIFVNDQPVKSEQTGLTAFPDNLATLQVLLRDRPAAQPAFALLEFPAPACERLSVTGGPARAHVVERAFPSSTWTVCHVWVGYIPGVYDLSLRITDRDGKQGEMITQRIEVLEEN